MSPDARAGNGAVVDGETLIDHREGNGTVVDAETLLDQREANEKLVLATLLAHELAEKATAAQALAERATDRVGEALARAEALARDLEASERELRQTAEFREQLLGIVGHDLRNPLASIKMAASLLVRNGALGEADMLLADRIVRSSGHMGRMIEQLLDFTRARLGGGLPIEPEPADLREILRDAVEELELGASVRFRTDAWGDVTGIWDADRLREVFSNILGNALQHATPGTLIAIDAWEEGAWAMVEITNQGDPITPDLLPFLFDPFRRGNQRRKTKSSNLGLGLYIAQQVLLSHGGAITARSTRGTTTFALRLPRSATASRIE